MTPSKLKFELEKRKIQPHFFTRENMKFAGDTMANFGCYQTTITYRDFTENKDITCEVWKLYRKRKTSKGFTGCFYFNKETFERIFV